MKMRTFGVIALGFVIYTRLASAETDLRYIEKNAIDASTSHFSSQLKARLSHYQVLLVGEMHGSNEHPAFVLDLAKNLAKLDHKLAVGLEIPVNEQSIISEAIASKDPFVLLRSPFFQSGFQDGRESIAMALLIVALGEIQGVEVFCFDKDSSSNAQDRDLEMAKNVVRHVKSSGAAQTILLAGNLHTRLNKGYPHDPNFVPMAFYLPRVEGSIINASRMLSMLGRIERGSYWACYSSNADECDVKRSPGATKQLLSCE